MKHLAVLVALIAMDSPVIPQDASKKSDQYFFMQFVGEWAFESEAVMEPGKDPIKSKGTESTRAMGTTWIVAETKGDAFGTPFTAQLTVGHDAIKNKIIGTWLDSMSNHMIQYEGTVDEATRTLTLTADAPNPMLAGKMSKFKDTFQLKSKDEKILTSSVLSEEGKWVTFLTVKYQRKK